MRRTLVISGAATLIAIAAVAAQESRLVVVQQSNLPGGPYQEIEGQAFKHTTSQADRVQGPRGRYRTLLRTIEVPQDRDSYGDFYDFGYWAGTSYVGQENLPSGYWVYLAPKWYIFKEDVSGSSQAVQGPRQWGPEQATGAPDTWPRSGDIGTAWASKTPDGQREWLELTYDAPIRTVAVMIYETFNPGAVDRITTYDETGKEVELWSGTDPTPAGKDKGISVIPLHPDFDFTRIRIYLNSQMVPGWNEIDAVGVVDASGKTHWAVSATASSTYADAIRGEAPASVPIFELRDRTK